MARRRGLARKLIDLGDAKTAYRIVRRRRRRAILLPCQFHFMADWIALRFLHDPSLYRAGASSATSTRSSDPIVGACRLLARPRRRGGRTSREMHAQYETAARYPTTYTAAGERPARSRTRSRCVPRAAEPAPAPRVNCGAAADILDSIGERDLALSFMTDLARESNDVASVAAVGQGAPLRCAVRQRLAQIRRRALVWLLATAVAALGTDETAH